MKGLLILAAGLILGIAGTLFATTALNSEVTVASTVTHPTERDLALQEFMKEHPDMNDFITDKRTIVEFVTVLSVEPAKRIHLASVDLEDTFVITYDNGRILYVDWSQPESYRAVGDVEMIFYSSYGYAEDGSFSSGGASYADGTSITVDRLAKFLTANYALRQEQHD